MADDDGKTADTTADAGKTGDTGAKGTTDKAADTGAKDKAAAGGDKTGDKGAKGADDWRVIPDDFQDRDEIAKRIATFNSPAELARSFWNAEKQVSRAIVPLGKNPSTEDIARYRKQLHIPEDFKGYHDTVKLDPIPGIDLESDAGKAEVEAFFKDAHDLHLPPGQVKGLMQRYLTRAADKAKAAAERAEQLADAADEKLRSEMRTGYDAFNKTGELFVKAVAKDLPEFGYMLENAIVDGMKLGDHPVMRRVAGMLGRKMGEQQLATLTMSDKDVGDAKKSVEDLTRQIHEADSKNDRATRDRLIAERRALSQKLHGGVSAR